MESTLRIRIVGNYHLSQTEEGNKKIAEIDDCKICHNPDFGDVIVNGICGKCLLHHYDSTIGENTMTIQETDNEKQPSPLAAGDGYAIEQSQKLKKCKGIYDGLLKVQGISHFKRRIMRWRAKRSFEKFLSMLKY